jgi:trehalose 6-phosphate synthase/phosphatase
VEQIDNEFVSRPSSGGLISAISAYLKDGGKGSFSDVVWAGVPGCSEKIWQTVTSKVGKDDYTYLPVFISSETYESYYNGFSNSLLWPLFHYFPSYVDYNPAYYESYMEVNKIFAGILSKEVRKEDIVWIHDYHLLPLASMLRHLCPGITIGFFLHIPFPSYELFRVMPKVWQRGLLTGMLGADLIGFHTLDYASHFLSSVEELLRIEHDGQYVSWQNREVKADAFPISIDYDLFRNAYDNPKVIGIRERYLRIKGDRKMIFSVDRLDYTKGISKRLNGYEQFLSDNPEYAGKIIFALVVVPSRDTIEKYAERKQIIDETVGNLNSRSGDIAWQPILYIYGHLSFEELTALYTACDLALITPIRDGMNLVSKEFVASRKDRQGVLVLSEMAGAANELTEALLINPNDVREIAIEIKNGLEMDKKEQERRMTAMQDRIRRYDVNAWASDFFDQLMHVKSIQLEFEFKFLDNMTRLELVNKYSHSAKRLLLLDYDGSLVPFARLPAEASPGEDVLETLRNLSADPRNEVYIVSGRDSQTLESWFSGFPIGLISEHGAKVRHKEGQWETAVKSNTDAWMPGVEKIMEVYVSRCPHSFIEKKEFSIAWHYRNADLNEGIIRAGELYKDLERFASSSSLNVLNGHKVIEVRMKGINKGIATAKLLDRSTVDFILSIGDDETDEDMFKKLATLPEAYTIKIGNDASFAKYNLYNPGMVQSLLQTISNYHKMP